MRVGVFAMGPASTLLIWLRRSLVLPSFAEEPEEFFSVIWTHFSLMEIQFKRSERLHQSRDGRSRIIYISEMTFNGGLKAG